MRNEKGGKPAICAPPKCVHVTAYAFIQRPTCKIGDVPIDLSRCICASASPLVCRSGWSRGVQEGTAMRRVQPALPRLDYGATYWADPVATARLVRHVTFFVWFYSSIFYSHFCFCFLFIFHFVSTQKYSKYKYYNKIHIFKNIFILHLENGSNVYKNVFHVYEKCTMWIKKDRKC